MQVPLDFNWLRNTSFCPAKGADEFSHFKIVGGGGGGGIANVQMGCVQGCPMVQMGWCGGGVGVGGGGVAGSKRDWEDTAKTQS